MPGTRRRLSADVRREQILEAAAALFIERGFESVKMADIAEKLGTSRPNIYTYYPSTEAILAVLLDRFAAEYLKAVSQALAENPTLDLLGALKILKNQRELLLLLHSGGGPLFRERRRQINEILDRHSYEYLAMQPWKLDPKKAELLVMTQRNIMLDVTYQALLDPQLDLETLAALLEEMLTLGFQKIAVL